MRKQFLVSIALSAFIATAVSAEQPVVEPSINVENCIADQRRTPPADGYSTCRNCDCSSCKTGDCSSCKTGECSSCKTGDCSKCRNCKCPTCRNCDCSSCKTSDGSTCCNCDCSSCKTSDCSKCRYCNCSSCKAGGASSRSDPSKQSANDDDEDDRGAAGRCYRDRCCNSHRSKPEANCCERKRFGKTYGAELDYSGAESLDKKKEERCENGQHERCQSQTTESQSNAVKQNTTAGISSSIVIKEAVQ